MIAGYLYYFVYYNVMLLVVFATSCVVSSFSNEQLLNQTKSFPFNGMLLSIVLALYWGNRPPIDMFADTVGYYDEYLSNLYTANNWRDFSDPLWRFVQVVCHSFGLTAQQWLLVVACLNIAPIFVACRRLFGNHASLGVLFFVISFSFVSMISNILRMGVAASFMILALSYINGKKKDFFIGILLALIAMGFHKSIGVTAVGFCVVFFMHNKVNVRLYVLFWVACLITSLFVGTYFQTLFNHLELDEKFSKYLLMEADGYNTGFRIDFVIYSVVPIIYSQYMKRRRNWNSLFYDLILETYIVVNAFWLLVIRVPFSDRFALLSWILMPLLFGFPLLKRELFRYQGRVLGAVLLAIDAFTYFMYIR